MTPYEYLCEQILMKRIRAHVYDMLDRNYRDTYSDVVAGLHNDLKNLIVGQTADNGSQWNIEKAVAFAVETYVKDGNMLTYDDDMVAFLSTLGVQESFPLPTNVDTLADFYKVLMESELLQLYNRYLKANDKKFEYRMAFQGMDANISERYKIELKKW